MFTLIIIPAQWYEKNLQMSTPLAEDITTSTEFPLGYSLKNHVMTNKISIQSHKLRIKIHLN
ncbi:hypothetical protein IV04_13820 [Serratia sp. Ag1]|nr:hypothetical protein JV45_02265 [Serratia sp. Ag2]KFK97973.1 hypothetical protein IV04_13820 [Serratia sp. Ag1]